MSITSVAGKSIADNIDTIRIHDTILARDTLVIVQQAGMEIVDKVQSFYSESFNHLLALLTIAIAIATGILGWVLPYFQKKRNKIILDDFTKSLNEQKQNAERISESIDAMKNDLDSHKTKYDEEATDIKNTILNFKCNYHLISGLTIATELTEVSNYMSLTFITKALHISTYNKDQFDIIFNEIHVLSKPEGIYHKVINNDNEHDYSAALVNLNRVIDMDNNEYFSKKAIELKELLIDGTITQPQTK